MRQLEPRRPKRKPVDQELLEVVDTASDVIIKTDKGRLSKEIIMDMLQWLAEGIPISKIAKRIARKHKRVVQHVTIKRYAKEFAPRIRQLSEEWDKEVVRSGLARKSVRVQKLERLAGAIETQLMPDPETDELELGAGGAKIVDVYRQLLNQIAVEVGDHPVGLGDTLFIGMSNEELQREVDKILSRNKDLAVIAAERAGVRPQRPTEDEQIVNTDPTTEFGGPSGTDSGGAGAPEES